MGVYYGSISGHLAASITQSPTDFFYLYFNFFATHHHCHRHHQLWDCCFSYNFNFSICMLMLYMYLQTSISGGSRYRHIASPTHQEIQVPSSIRESGIHYY
ncbi:hypothetical protein AAHE18_14G112800 [Arachis hypogaea]